MNSIYATFSNAMHAKQAEQALRDAGFATVQVYVHVLPTLVSDVSEPVLRELGLTGPSSETHEMSTHAHISVEVAGSQAQAIHIIAENGGTVESAPMTSAQLGVKDIEVATESGKE